MSGTQLGQTARDMLYLSACALHSVAPERERLAGMDLARLYPFARYHVMTAAVCMALEAGGGFQGADPALVKQWQDEKNKAVRKNLLLETECRQILGYMEEQGIWHMPLKGAILKDMYPQFGMRQMADYDILFDPARQRQMREYMLGRGYTVKGYGKGVHDSYYKPPVYNFELHRALFSALRSSAWCAYYGDVRERLIPDSPGSYGYHFSDEDFYVYLTVHARKHYENAGTGLRSLMDCYVYCREKGAEMDWDYIAAELDKLGVAVFERQCRELSSALFAAPEPQAADALTGEQRTMLAYFAGSGAYGTFENRVGRRLREIQPDGGPVSRKTRWRYLWSRLAPNLEVIRLRAPFCYRHRWAIPFFLVYRAFYGIFRRGGLVRKEIRAVLGTKNPWGMR